MQTIVQVNCSFKRSLLTFSSHSSDASAGMTCSSCEIYQANSFTTKLGPSVWVLRMSRQKWTITWNLCIPWMPRRAHDWWLMTLQVSVHVSNIRVSSKRLHPGSVGAEMFPKVFVALGKWTCKRDEAQAPRQIMQWYYVIEYKQIVYNDIRLKQQALWTLG